MASKVRAHGVSPEQATLDRPCPIRCPILRDMGYLIEIDSLSCHVTHAKPETSSPHTTVSETPIDNKGDKLLEQTELNLDASLGAIKNG